MTDQKLAFARRQTQTGTVYFVTNRGEKVYDGWIPLLATASSAAIFNPMDDKYGLAKSRALSNGGLEVYARLNPFESLIINTHDIRLKGKLYDFYNPLSSPNVIKGNWKIEFTEGGPALPPAKEITVPVSWTEMGGDEYKSFSGTARYTISFGKPAGKGDAWLLDLGKVCQSANVTLNGKELAVLPGPDFRVVISKKLLKANNSLLINVSNLMANRIAWMDKNGIVWKKFYNVNMAARLKQNTKNGLFDASAWEPMESGVVGPVTLTPVKKVK
jgi:hypothetical protein